MKLIDRFTTLPATHPVNMRQHVSPAPPVSFAPMGVAVRRAPKCEGGAPMHRRQTNVFTRLAGLVVAAVLATISAAAVTNSSGAALPIPFSQKTVKISNAYQMAQCSLVINAHDFDGNN